MSVLVHWEIHQKNVWSSYSSSTWDTRGPQFGKRKTFHSAQTCSTVLRWVTIITNKPGQIFQQYRSTIKTRPPHSHRIKNTATTFWVWQSGIISSGRQAITWSPDQGKSNDKKQGQPRSYILFIAFFCTSGEYKNNTVGITTLYLSV